MVPTPANRELHTEMVHVHFGHCGRDKMREALSSEYWWPKMDNTICKILRQCIPCVKAKNYKTFPKKQLYPTAKGY